MFRTALLAAAAILISPAAFAMSGNGWNDVTTYTTDAQGTNADNQILDLYDNGSVVVTTPTTVTGVFGMPTTTGIAIFTSDSHGQVYIEGNNGVVSSSLDSAIAVVSNGSVFPFPTPNTASLDFLLVDTHNLVTTSNTIGAATIALGGIGATEVVNDGTITHTGPSGNVFDVDTQELDLTNGASGVITGNGVSPVFALGGSATATNSFALDVTNSGTIDGNGAAILNNTNNITFRYTQTAGSTVGDINFGTASNSVLSIEAGTFAGNITSDNTATGNTISIYGGEYTGTVNIAASDGSFNVSGGIANLTGVNSAPSFRVYDQGLLNLGDTATSLTATFNGLIVTSGQLGAGTLALGTAAHTLTGDLTIDAGATLRTTVASNTAQDNGKLAVSGLITIADGAQLVTLLPTGANMVTGTKQFTLLTGAGADVGTFDIVNPYILYDITDVSTAGNRTIEITRLIDPNAPSTPGGNGPVYSDKANNQAAATALFQVQNPDNAVSAFQDRVNASTSQGQLDGALNELTPQADNGANQQTFGTAIAAADLIDVRLGTLRTGDTGLSGGDRVTDRHAWVQGFGATTSQGQRDGVNGYGANSGGVAFGVDGQLDTAKTALGVSFSYAGSDVHSHDNLKQTDIDSYQANLYASQPVDTGVDGLGTWFVDALVGFAWNEFDTARHINAPAVTAKGDYSGQTYLARLATTRSYDVSGAFGRGFSLTPGASLTYAYNHFEDYTEHGAGGLNLNVDQKNADLLEGKLGTGLGYTFQADRNVTVRPGVHANVLYDFLNDSVGRTSTFTGSGGANFATAGQRAARSGFNAGADLTVFSADCGLDVVATYDYERRSDFNAHSGQLRVRAPF